MNHKKILNVVFMLFLSGFIFSQDALNIDANGKVIVEKELEVKGQLSTKSAIVAEKTLTVTEGITAQSTLDVNGDTTVKKVTAENVVVTGTINKTTSDGSTVTTTSYDPLPIGTILMFNGTGWQDNVTIEGWYRCIAANTSHGVPDLENRFIMGSSSSGGTGGANTTTEIIAHSHTATASTKPAFTPTGTTSTNGDHSHTYTDVYHPHEGPRREPGGSTDAHVVRLNPLTTDSKTTGSAGDHSHTLNVSTDPAWTPTITINSEGTESELDNRPLYYSVIFIMKVR